MMTIYGTIRNGRKVVVMRDGSGYEYVSYMAGAKKIKTPQASGAGEAQLKSYTQMSNTANAGVKKFSALA